MSNRKKIIIAIDGPAGSGKSSTAKKVAELLHYTFLDSGAMYRAVTLQVLNENVDVADAEKVAAVAEKCTLHFQDSAHGQLVFLNNIDVSLEIRSPQVTSAIAPIAANPLVRNILVEKQREIGRDGGIVAEGRDMTSVVFADAELKVYMNASIQQRALRRRNELAAQNIHLDLQQLENDIRKRDESDANREHGALTMVPDAFIIDTSDLDFIQQVELIVAEARKRGA